MKTKLNDNKIDKGLIKRSKLLLLAFSSLLAASASDVASGQCFSSGAELCLSLTNSLCLLNCGHVDCYTDGMPITYYTGLFVGPGDVYRPYLIALPRGSSGYFQGPTYTPGIQGSLNTVTNCVFSTIPVVVYVSGCQGPLPGRSCPDPVLAMKRPSSAQFAGERLARSAGNALFFGPKIAREEHRCLLTTRFLSLRMPLQSTVQSEKLILPAASGPL